MRTNLKPFRNIRYTYIGDFEKYSTKKSNGYVYINMLLTNVTNCFGDFICDHIWLGDKEAKKFDKLNLKNGDKVMFTAVVKTYKKYNNKQWFDKCIDLSNVDYRLAFIENIQKIS